METLENRSRVYASVHLCICVWLMWVCTQEYTCEWISGLKATEKQSEGKKKSKLWMQECTNGACGVVRVNGACRLC